MSSSTSAEQTRLGVETEPTALCVLKALLSAWQAAALYEENNNAYRSRREQLLKAAADACSEAGACQIGYQGGYFFFNGERLNYGPEFHFGRALAFRFSSLKIGQLTFESGVPADVLDQALFSLAHTDTKLENPFNALTDAWSALHIKGVTIGPISDTPTEAFDREESSADRDAARRKRAHALFGRAESFVQEMWERVRDRNSFDASSTQRIVHQLIDQIAHDEETLLEFVALRDFDEYTYFHSVNVAIYSIAVGMRLGLDRRSLTQLGLAALFHDIGKVKLPRDLITKPDEFDADDWEQMKQHPILGALTIASLHQIDADIGSAMAGAFEHHLRMDGSGYPKVTGPRQLHLYTKIVTLCDAFDAMTSGRVYQKVNISPDEAMRRLIYKGREWYDPVILKALVHVLGLFPVGTVARLTDGSTAIVVRNCTEDLYAPEVLIIRDDDGTPTRRAARLAGASNTPGHAHLSIDQILDPDEENINIGDYIAVSYQATDDTGAARMT
jgi:HD-GYP domain-containing protein (c-di-GMP phosphodiesterase class II)